MRQIVFLFLSVCCFVVATFSQPNQNTRFVAVQETTLKSSTAFFSNNITNLSFGDTVALLQENGKWSRVRFGNQTGWLPASSLTRRQIVAGSTASFSTNEIAFGGKGFTPEMEIEYRNNGLDFSAIDTMEQIKIPLNDLLRFVNEGRLFKGDQTSTYIPKIIDNDITLADNYYLGRAVGANILASYKPHTQNQQATQYLNSICQSLAINSDYPEIFRGYFVMILDSNEINAFASPGGHLFITKKFIELANSEDMLAAIIAHELAHIMLRHSNSIINETRVEDELIEIANWASGVAAQYSEEAARAADFRSSVTKTVDVLMKNGYSIAQEYEADMEAVTLLAKAGYDPKALLELLNVLQQAQGSQISGLYSTHPSPAQRITNLETLRFANSNTRRYRTQRFFIMKF